MKQIWFADDPWGSPKVDMGKLEKLIASGVLPL